MRWRRNYPDKKNRFKTGFFYQVVDSNPAAGAPRFKPSGFFKSDFTDKLRQVRPFVQVKFFP
jgi:hypothetical protein